MKATVCRPNELGATELERWRAIQTASPAVRHPFLTAEFALAVGESSSKHARVAVVEDGNEIAGFFAYNTNSLGVARPIGARLGYRQGFVCADGLRWSWAELMRATGIHAIEFTDLLGHQAGAGDGLEIHEAPIIDTSVGWDAYIANARHHSHVRKAMQRARRLERERGAIDYTWGPAAPEGYARLIAWKSLQYRLSGWPDPFARPWIRETLDALRDHGDGDLKVVFTTMRSGDDLFAVDMSLTYQDVFAAWFSAYDQAFAGYSPGSIRRLHTIERACRDHFAYIDLARGDEPYKQDFKTGDVPVASGLRRDHSGPALVYRSIRAPYKGTREWILHRPRTRAFVRSSLRNLGALRVKAGPR